MFSWSRDFSVSALTAGFLAVLISYSGPLLIFFQAGQSAGISPAMMASWVWGISMGAALAGILFQFGVGAFRSASSMPRLTFGMIAAYLLW